MPTIVQFRRGTEAQSDNFTGNVGELSVDTTNETVRVHDGSTAGGSRLATYVEVADRMQVANVQSLVTSSINTVIDSAPGALDTLNELAAALGDDANFSTTVTTSIGEKLAKASNLSDLTNATTARTNLGLGTVATTDATAYATAAQGSTADSAVQNLADLGITSTAAEINKLDGYTGSVTELNYLDALHATGVTSTEIGYLDGVTSAIQTQLNAKGIGDITGVTAGTGLTGGGASGTVTVNVDVGTTASKIVQLDGSARLPAVDGSQLTGISAGATVTDKTDNVNYNVVFTSETSGTQSLAGIDSGAFTFNPSTGQCNATTFNSTSDVKLKKNIETISDSLNKVSQLRGVNFDWKKNNNTSMGVVAQEVEVVVPEVVSTDEKDQKSVNYGALVGLLIEAVKDLKNEVNELKANK